MKLDTNIYLPCEQFLGEASPDPAFNEPEVEAEDQETENKRTAVDDGSVRKIICRERCHLTFQGSK